MNIRQAKDYIKNTVHIYLKKGEQGEYVIPVVRQRPIFLLGAPGIGKTAVMEQIAQEMGIGLVAYSMTHHTRQSALGLPFILHKTYQGQEFDVSEYTMSEIIASVYETMEESGIREGILFLDEINCVSETLAPAMLQFLQYKVFGRHQVPEGWVIVTAGNPPEYNKSVREFDVATLDRLRILQVEPDLRIWREYAREKRLHGAILNFLDLKKEFFYHMETTPRGRSYVTARGWEDLSQILLQYEEEGLAVEEALVEQYIRNERIAREFSAYYDLYQKYRKDYRVQDILEGKASPQAIGRARAAAFDERLSLLGMLIDRILADMQEVMERGAYLKEVRVLLLGVRQKVSSDPSVSLEEVCRFLEGLEEAQKNRETSLERAGALSPADKRKFGRILVFLREARRELWAAAAPEGEACFAYLKGRFEREVAGMQEQTGKAGARLHCLFAFVEEAFEKGNELLILVTELTANSSSAGFIASFGSPDYQRCSGELMLGERQDRILERISALDL